MARNPQSSTSAGVGYSLAVECYLPLNLRRRVFAQHPVNDVMMTLGTGYAMSGVALLVTGLILNWELGLVMLACVPFIGGSVAVLSKLMSGSTQEGNDHYSRAGGVATEVRVFVKERAERLSRMRALVASHLRQVPLSFLPQWPFRPR